MKKKAFKYLCLSIIVGIGFLPAFAFAANPITDGLSYDSESLQSSFEFFQEMVAAIIFILGIVMILYAAFLYMTSAGDDSRIEKAKKTLIYGIVGIIVAMFAYYIWDSVYNFITGY